MNDGNSIESYFINNGFVIFKSVIAIIDNENVKKRGNKLN